MNNTAYVKKLEDVRNTIDVSNEKGHLKWTSKPSSILQKVFENDLVAILKVKILLTLNKSAYIGLYILDLGKVLKYGFHYDQIKNKYSNKSRELFTGNDSLIFEIKGKDAYENFSQEK